METIYHLVLWILVACHHTWSAQNVHGGFSQWSNWSGCSRSCAGGAQRRFRTCTNPPPENGGRDCSELGRATDLRKCNKQDCPVHGGYSQWSYWSQCTKSCGSGTQRRSRSCTNPPPANCGRNCSGLGLAKELQRCNTHSCPVHGGYSQWSDWSRCSQSCGRGKEYRIRFCTNPSPAHGGRECSSLGSPTELRTCNIRQCLVHGGYSQWSSWSHCSKSCGLGRKYHYRFCTNPWPAYGGRGCSSLGLPTETQTCNIQRCPVHGGYSQWSHWSQCSRSCDGGTQNHDRSCTNPPPTNGGKDCSRMGRANESRTCNTYRCPVSPTASVTPGVIYGNVGDSATFTCTATGIPTPNITWYRSGKQVSGYEIISVTANSSQLTIKKVTYADHGYYECRATSNRMKPANARSFLGVITDLVGDSLWSYWSQCTKSCGSGTQCRSRSCTNPLPANSGRNCSGLGQATELQRCNTHNCPVHGGYSQWSVWSQCSKTCGSGKQYRYRSCTNPRPAYGGRVCNRLGPAKESQTCNEYEHRGFGSLELCDKVHLPPCSPHQWILRCKFTNSLCRIYFSTCRVNTARKKITCDSAIHSSGSLECCEARCT